MPLHNTRSQVEHILGLSTDQCRCFYKTTDASIYVEYAKGRCKGSIVGWNVPPETVLSLTVYPKVHDWFADLKLNPAKYRVREDDTSTKYYSNRDEGIQYAVSSDGQVKSISYIPSLKDRRLRCAGFSMEDGSTFDYVKFDNYGELSFESESARLDSLAVLLTETPNISGYIMVYAGRIACPSEALIRANRARDYLMNQRGIAPKRIRAIDGGYRENLSVELYAIPTDADPPTAVPTIASREVRIVEDLRKCRTLRGTSKTE